MPDILFFDWETRGPDLTLLGSLNYALDDQTRILLLTYCFDKTGPVKKWVPDLSDILPPDVWEMVKSMVDCHTVCPPEIKAHIEAGGLVCAWYAAFDRTIWQQIATPELGFPKLHLKQTLDSMVQASASNLPGGLEFAGRALNLGGKTAGGKGTMLLFANIEIPIPTSKTLWQEYIDYGARDTSLMRRIWYATRPLSLEEWIQYWASERINDRGIRINEPVCKGAIKYREEEKKHINKECSRLTDGVINRPTLTKAINQWVYERLPDDLQDRMVKKRDEDGNPTSLTLAKDTLAIIKEDIKQHEAPPDDNVLGFMDLLEHGRSSSSIKFEKMLNQAVDGRLCSSYIFGGAGQTGRYSSRGVQIHNLPRDRLDDEILLLDLIAKNAPIEEIRKYGSVNHVLSRLIRPTFIAEEGKTFVWGDWSAIEAIVLPWLAGSRKAYQSVLVPFQNGEDIYVINAAKIFDRDYRRMMELIIAAKEYRKKGLPLPKEVEIAIRQRQAGKVAVLALGFGGSVGAYRAMARGYGIQVTNEQAKIIVYGWREANPWAKRFWYGTLKAALNAIKNPGVYYESGRLRYVFNSGLMGGTLLCFLPDGRPLAYPKAKIVREENKFGKMTEVIYYLNKMSYQSLWYGILVENPVQGYAASLLRDLLVRLDEYDCTVFHTHDEGGVEVPVRETNLWMDRLGAMMETPPPHAQGLPLKADITSDNWYHK